MARVWNRILKERLSRRRLLGSAAAASAAGITLAACGGGTTTNGDPTPSGTTDEDEVTKDGILRTSTTIALPSFSPFGASALGAELVFGFFVFDHLWYVPLDTQNVEYFLADSIENPDGDGMEIIVTMKESFFHDKPPVNARQVLASDVKASWEAFRDDLEAPGRPWLQNIMDSIEAPDDSTVVIRQKEPYAWVYHPAGAGSPGSSSILPAETLPGSGYNLAQDLIGSGRLVLPSGANPDILEMFRHQNWRIPGEPYLAGTKSSLVTEPAAALAAFAAGEIDSVGFQNKLEADQMQERLGDQMYVDSDISRTVHALWLKVKPPFDDVEVRRAFNLAIDRQALIQGVELAADGGVPAAWVPPAQAAYALSDDDMAEYFRHDTAEARSILEAKDFPFDQEFTLKYGEGEEAQIRALLLKEQLAAAGIKVNIEGQDLLTVWLPQTLQQGDFDMTLVPHLAYDDPVIPLSFITNESKYPTGDNPDPRGRNNMDFYDDEITAAYHAMNSELEDEERIAKVQAVVRLAMEKMAPVFGLYSARTYAGRRSWYKGLVTGRGSFGTFNGRSWIDTNERGF